ncbi:MAG: hypothetical protein FWF55_09465 [Treponema sp.]|nr:hypothetical protein [Treponema sp.]
MKKIGLFLTIFLLLAASSFAQDLQSLQNKYLFIEGRASKQDHQDFFMRSFTMEANGSGYVVTASKSEALHTLRFDAIADPEEPDLYIISMSLYRNEDNAKLVSFDFYYESLEEMFTFVRTLFLNSVTSIPLPLLTEEHLNAAQGNQWDKWIYFSASFDYAITFYFLQPTGLWGKKALYLPNPENPVNPIAFLTISDVFKAMPGATLGVEVQPLNFLSVEINFQLSMGDTRDQYFVNMGVGADVNFPIKFKTFMLVPYASFVYPLTVSSVFTEFPPFMLGGGVQLCVRAGKRGILFMEAQYMFSFTDAVMRNPHPNNYPKPEVIHYQHSALGLGVGYKIGILDRPKKQPKQSQSQSGSAFFQ